MSADDNNSIFDALEALAQMALNLFPHRVVITPDAKDEFPDDFVVSCLDRHFSGDWGELDEEDKAANDDALDSGRRVLSAYSLRGSRLWIITEADRTATTILTPEEY
jgi:hypothetical protein